MNINTKILSSRLKELRQSLNITQSNFAESINVSTVSVSSYESEAKTPSLHMIYNIATTYNVSIDWLCGLSEKRNLPDRYTNYADVFRTLIHLCSTKYAELNSELLFPSFFDDNDEDMTFVVSEDKNFTTFFTDWFKMYKLYSDGTIDNELYNLWIEKEICKYDKPLDKCPF